MCRWKRACDQPPWSCRPGASSVRSAIGSSRPSRSASTRPCSRSDDGDEGAVPAPEQRHERREQEVVGDARRVGHGRRQREDAPDVVQPGREHGEPVGAVPVELAVEEPLEPLEVGLQPAAHLVREIGPRRAVRLRREVEQRVHARRRVAGRRDAARIEVEVEADRAAVLGPERRQLAQTVEADHRCRHIALSAWPGPILSFPGRSARNTSGLRFVLYREGAHARLTGRRSDSERRS